MKKGFNHLSIYLPTRIHTSHQLPGKGAQVDLEVLETKVREGVGRIKFNKTDWQPTCPLLEMLYKGSHLHREHDTEHIEHVR